MKTLIACTPIALLVATFSACGQFSATSRLAGALLADMKSGCAASTTAADGSAQLHLAFFDFDEGCAKQTQLLEQQATDLDAALKEGKLEPSAEALAAERKIMPADFRTIVVDFALPKAAGAVEPKSASLFYTLGEAGEEPLGSTDLKIVVNRIEAGLDVDVNITAGFLTEADLQTAEKRPSGAVAINGTILFDAPFEKALAHLATAQAEVAEKKAAQDPSATAPTN